MFDDGIDQMIILIVSSLLAMGSFVAGMIVQKAADGRLHNYHYVGFMAMAAMVCAIWIARKLEPMKSDVETVSQISRAAK